MGAFHKSARESWDHGILKLKGDLIDLKSEVRSLQRMKPIMENKDEIKDMLEQSSGFQEKFQDLQPILENTNKIKNLLQQKPEIGEMKQRFKLTYTLFGVVLAISLALSGLAIYRSWK
ncbi:hypothetical protein AKJ40_01245 [candidate division MSBL1 archaeon SCGC-AAA259M10]|uniref:Uncharacterized protein n=1 Tax=candidate division MSBL1 archaeon SCGC-AAA259M10 TaxID=1698270 RepID=A0A133V263_9EURY|nr:hypothetical protein AKJ40_01245 [candidate division MSBL1 archaeon SCGC-AAA259M10]